MKNIIQNNNCTSTKQWKIEKKSHSNIIFICITLLISFCLVQLITHFVGIVKVSGTSMLPTYRDGQLLIYSKNITNIEMGDIIIFKNKNTNNSFFIKRVIAVSGDTITISGTDYFLNGHKIKEKGLNQFFDEYEIDLKVASNELFVLGDNRDASFDSRSFGPISINDVIGVIKK